MANLLLLDAGRRLLDAYRPALETAGHSVIAADAVDAGLDRLREGGLDVVLAGGDAGHLDELVAGLLRLPDPPPIVLVSGDLGAPALSAHIGASAFLPEPSDPAELLAVIDRLVLGPVPATVDDVPTRPLERR